MPSTSPSIELNVRVPCSAEYVSVVRLAVLSLCGRVPISYDEVEDLRLAVGEACASSVERAEKTNTNEWRISLNASVDESRIQLEIQDNVPIPPDSEASPAAEVAEGDFDDVDFRLSLMQLLVDTVEIEERQGGGQVVRLVKLCETANEPQR